MFVCWGASCGPGYGLDFVVGDEQQSFGRKDHNLLASDTCGAKRDPICS